VLSAAPDPAPPTAALTSRPAWLVQIWEDPRDETFIALAEAEQLKPVAGYKKESSEWWVNKIQDQLAEDPLSSPDNALASPSSASPLSPSGNRMVVGRVSISEEIEEEYYEDDFSPEGVSRRRSVGFEGIGEGPPPREPYSPAASHPPGVKPPGTRVLTPRPVWLPGSTHSVGMGSRGSMGSVGLSSIGTASLENPLYEPSNEEVEDFGRFLGIDVFKALVLLMHRHTPYSCPFPPCPRDLAEHLVHSFACAGGSPDLDCRRRPAYGSPGRLDI